MSRYTWILDPGHGENTPGKRSPEVPPGVLEYEFNRAIANRVVAMCPDLEVLVTNPGPADMGKRQRTDFANYKQEELGNVVFISIHGNASGKGGSWESAKGAVAFIHKKNKRGKVLAGAIMEAFETTVLETKRGIKTSGFEVLKRTLGIPAALIECGFMTNLGDAVVMASPEGRDMIAEAFVKAIRHFETTGEL